MTGTRKATFAFDQGNQFSVSFYRQVVPRGNLAVGSSKNAQKLNSPEHLFLLLLFFLALLSCGDRGKYVIVHPTYAAKETSRR